MQWSTAYTAENVNRVEDHLKERLIEDWCSALLIGIRCEDITDFCEATLYVVYRMGVVSCV